MDSEQHSSSNSLTKPRPFQFSLATMFVITAAFAIILMICFTLPDPWSGAAWIILTIAAPPVLAVIIKFGPGGLSAFSIGAIVPTGMSLAGLVLYPGWESALPRASNYAIRPTVVIGDRMTALGNWVVQASSVGSVWRPIELSCWVAAILIGLLCVVVRRWVQRLGQ